MVVLAQIAILILVPKLLGVEVGPVLLGYRGQHLHLETVALEQRLLFLVLPSLTPVVEVEAGE